MIEIIASKSEIAKLSLQSEETSSQHFQLIKNEIIKGKVLRHFDPKNLQLLIKGRKITAKTNLSLKPGGMILLKVEKSFPNPILKVVTSNFNTTDAMNISLILSGIKKNLWESLFNKLDNYPIQNHAKMIFKQLVKYSSEGRLSIHSPDILKDIIGNSGLAWEAKLREILTRGTFVEGDIDRMISEDFKGLGSRILSLMGDQDDLLESFISTIKNIQLFNHQGLKQGGKIFIPFPIQFADGRFTVGQLLINYKQNKENGQGKEKKEREFTRISFLLELSRLGPLRADLSVREKEIQGRFLLVEEKVKHLIEENLSFFVDRLKEKGFSIIHMECHIKTEEVIKNSMVAEIVQEDGANISLFA